MVPPVALPALPGASVRLCVQPQLGRTLRTLRVWPMNHVHVSIYFDLRDWWVGYYRGDTYHYVCILPTLVIRWNRGHDR